MPSSAIRNGGPTIRKPTRLFCKKGDGRTSRRHLRHRFAWVKRKAERDAGRAVEVVVGQVAGSVPEGSTPENLVIAYEPVWAIGTGKTAHTR